MAEAKEDWGSKPTSDLTTNKNNPFLLYFRDEDSCSLPELKKHCTLSPVSAVRPAEESSEISAIKTPSQSLNLALMMFQRLNKMFVGEVTSPNQEPEFSEKEDDEWILVDFIGKVYSTVDHQHRWHLASHVAKNSLLTLPSFPRRTPPHLAQTWELLGLGVYACGSVSRVLLYTHTRTHTHTVLCANTNVYIYPQKM